VTFDRPSVPVSRDRIGTLAESFPALAMSPRAASGGAVAFGGIDSQGYWHLGVSRLAPDASIVGTTELHDRTFPDVQDPAIAFDATGRLHVVFVANNPDRPGNVLRYASSVDGGGTFDPIVPFLGESTCGLQCGTPSVAVGTSSGGGETLYVAVITGQPDGTSGVAFARASALTGQPDAPQTVVTREFTLRDRRAPALVALAAGRAPDEVWMATVERNLDSPLAALGDSINRVRVRVSRDGGRMWTTPVEVSRSDDAPAVQTPWVQVSSGTAYVAYIRAGLLGAWDVVLATSSDGGRTWAHRIANDDPDRCATHAFAGLAVDPASRDALLVWSENRFGNGMVVFARCPADSAQRCSRNEVVSSERFVFATTTDPLRTLGRASVIAVDSDGRPWAAWADSRVGGTNVYVARGQLR